MTDLTQDLTNKVAVITGASSGFGEAIARAFDGAGAKLVLVARQSEPLERVAASIHSSGGHAITLCGDVKDPNTFEQAFSLAHRTWQRVDILVNNAGGGVVVAGLEEQTPDSIREALDLNLASVIHGCRSALPYMKRNKGGIIINVGSACAHFAWPDWSVYSAAKAGVSMFSRCLYAEVRPHGIAVSVITPGGANTGFQTKAAIAPFGWREEDSLRPEHIARAALSIACMPEGAVVPEMVVYGKAQEIIPF